MFQDFANIWIISKLTFFLHHGLRPTDIKFNSFQFHTHTHFIPAKKYFLYIKVCRYNIFNFIVVYLILYFVNKNMLQNIVYTAICIISGPNFFVTMVFDIQIQNLIYFNSIQLFNIWIISGIIVFLHHGLQI